MLQLPLKLKVVYLTNEIENEPPLSDSTINDIKTHLKKELKLNQHSVKSSNGNLEMKAGGKYSLVIHNKRV